MGVAGERTEPTGWEIAVAVNAAFKGLLGAMGQSGSVCRDAIPVEVFLDTDAGYRPVLAQSVAALTGVVRSGDTVVIADKVLAVAQGRVCSAEVLRSPDPKTVDEEVRKALAVDWAERCGFAVSPLHLLLADEYHHPTRGPLATLGCADHNEAAHDLAAAIRSTLDVEVDVVVSDTDTGTDVRRTLIGTVTFGSTPLGATGGLTIYECMRCACAAEFVRGHDRQIPLVVCRPADRCASRPRMGRHRGYGGVLDPDREGGLAHA